MTTTAPRSVPVSESDSDNQKGVQHYQAPLSHTYDKGKSWDAVLYDIEDELLDICEELPSEEKIRAVIASLKPRVVRRMAGDLFCSSVALCKNENDILSLARTLNSWSATGEILATTTPSKLTAILKAREEIRKEAKWVPSTDR